MLKRRFFLFSILLFLSRALLASDYRGVVVCNGHPLPGATVTISQGDKSISVVTDGDGAYAFTGMADGVWTVAVEMTGFSPLKKEVTLPFVPAPGSAAAAAAQQAAAQAAGRNAGAGATGATAAGATSGASGTTGTTAAGSGPPPLVTASPGAYDITEVTIAAYTGPAPAPVTTAPSSAAAGNTESKNNGAGSSAAAKSQFQRSDLNATGNTAPSNGASQAPAPPPAINFGGADASNTSDALTINGSMNNGAASPYAQSAAIGNNRRGGRGLYSGTFSVRGDNSVFDAKPYSIGVAAPRAPYTLLTLAGSVGGPMLIPGIFSLRNAPFFFVNYTFTHNDNDRVLNALVPTADEQTGLFPASDPIINPATGMQFTNNQITSINAQAAQLLKLIPLPNIPLADGFNYQIPAVTPTLQNAMSVTINPKPIQRTTNVSGNFGFQKVHSSNFSPNIFGFNDTMDSFGLQSVETLRHSFTQRFTGTLTYTFNHYSTTITPFFAGNTNISGNAGITGNLQDPNDYGPPQLSFATSGIAGLSDANYLHNRQQSDILKYVNTWNHGGHNIEFGGSYTRQDWNTLQQSNPRGTFTFNGLASSGGNTLAPGAQNDFADFLLGIPDGSTVAFGQPDRYYRESIYNLYFKDDWRISSSLTANLGVAWDYYAPVTELQNRLVNLDVTPGFTAETPVLASNPVGPVSGLTYPSSLVIPDKNAYEPRLGLAWRPFPADSLVLKAGWGRYYNTSTYQSIATAMATQAPLDTLLQSINSSATPLTLANGFVPSASLTTDNFAIDPHFRLGYADDWFASAQRDLPGGLVLTANYTGIKGSHALQAFDPNTYAGTVNPCTTCGPAGYTFLASSGNSTNEQFWAQLLRRFHAGLQAQVKYTYSDAYDDASQLGGGINTNRIAQNWQDLDAERGPSSGIERQAVAASMQYTTGIGARGGAMLSGWRGRAYKGWTLGLTGSGGTGFPLTPLDSLAILQPVNEAVLRPELVAGQPIYQVNGQSHLNPAAFTNPAPGTFGNAGRGSIFGPSVFQLNGNMARSFQLSDRVNMAFTASATNVLNQVTYTSWGTNIAVPSQFGAPTAANQMRRFSFTFRFNF